MSPGIGSLRLVRAPSAQLAAWSRTSLDRALGCDAELVIAEPSDTAIVLGAHQRTSELGDAGATGAHGVAFHRGSGGAEACVGPGTLWMQLTLARSDALVACEPNRLCNRYVRPLLRALTKSGALAHYFDRDWISVQKRPIGMIAFAHDTTSGRAFVEAILGVSTPFALRARPSYLGKSPATLAELGMSIELEALGDRIVEAYASAHDRTITPIEPSSLGAGSPGVVVAASSWSATRDEAIGVIGAGRDASGRMRIGGELMASRDAIARLEERLATLASPPDETALGRALDETLGAPGVALLGVRSLGSLREALLEAYAQNP